MSLKLRRGPDADRQGVTFAEGELVYVTDYASQGVSPLWIGDGTTAGGVPVVNPENPISTIVGLDDVDASTVSIGQVLKWDGTKWVNSDDTFGTSGGAGVIEGTNYRINIVAEDSTLIVNSDTGVVTADVIGDVTGNVTGSIVGDLKGSVFADDSTVLIDSINNTVSASSVSTSNILAGGNGLTISSDNTTALTVYGITGGISNGAYQNYRTSRGTLGAPIDTQTGDFIGGFNFSGWYNNSYKSATQITTRWDIGSDLTASNPGSVLVFVTNDNSTGQNYAYFDSRGRWVAPIIQTGSYTEIPPSDNRPSNPEPGMIIFVSDAASGSKFQGYDGTAWVPLG